MQMNQKMAEVLAHQEREEILKGQLEETDSAYRDEMQLMQRKETERQQLQQEFAECLPGARHASSFRP